MTGEATAARRLLESALDAGWGGLFSRHVDSRDRPYVVVKVQHPTTGAAFEATWHTRDTGAYRLFSSMQRTGPKGASWVDVPLKTIKAAITATHTTEGTR